MLEQSSRNVSFGSSPPSSKGYIHFASNRRSDGHIHNGRRIRFCSKHRKARARHRKAVWTQPMRSAYAGSPSTSVPPWLSVKFCAEAKYAIGTTMVEICPAKTHFPLRRPARMRPERHRSDRLARSRTPHRLQTSPRLLIPQSQQESQKALPNA